MKKNFNRVLSLVLVFSFVFSSLVYVSPSASAAGLWEYEPDSTGDFYSNALYNLLVVQHGSDKADAVVQLLNDYCFSFPKGEVSKEQFAVVLSQYNSDFRKNAASLLGITNHLGIAEARPIPELGIVRMYDTYSNSWITDLNGDFPFYYASGDVPAGSEGAETIAHPSISGNKFIDVRNLNLDSTPVNGKYDRSTLSATLYEFNTEYGESCVLELASFGDIKYWVIMKPGTTSAAYLCDSRGYPIVGIYEPSATNNQYDYIINDNSTTDNSIVVNDSQIIDIENGILNLIDDSGTKISLNIEDLIFDIGDKTYTVNAYSTTNEGDNHYYTYYTYNIQYNIANTYITYIGSNDAYDKEEYKYYYELPDGRSSADLTADEIAGMSFEFHDVVNYERSATDVSVRALYHFDGDINDSSYFSTQGKFEWTNGASITYMEAPEAFDGALYLDNTAHSFNIVLPSGLGSADSTIQFRYYQASEPDTQDNIDNFIKIGGTYVLCWDEKTVSRDPDGEHAAWTLPVGTWNEIALVRDDGQLLVYLNGLCVSREAYSTVWGDTITFELGSGSRAYSMIDELRVLNRPITSLGDDYIFVSSIDQCTDPDQLYVLPDGYIYKYSESRLPEGYTQVKYIRSSGTQYINTQYKPNGSTEVEFSFNGSSADGVMFGAYNSAWTNGYGLYTNVVGGYNYYFHYAANTELPVASQTAAKFNIANGSVEVNGSTALTGTAASFTVNYPLYIFAGNWGGSRVEQPTSYELEYFKIGEKGTLFRDYVPCINPDNEAGLYDLVTRTFYGNSGSGTFTAGPAVSSTWTSTGVRYDSLGYGDGTSYTPTAVPYDSNLVLVLPDSAKPIADEYWSFNSDGNLLSNYDFTTAADHSEDWYYNPSSTTVLYGDACSVTNNSTLDLASSVPGYCAGQKTIDSANGDYVPSNGLVSSLGHMAIVENRFFNWASAGYFYRPDLNNTYTLSVVGVDGETYSHTFTVSAVTTTDEEGLVGNDRTYTEFDWGYLFYYRRYDGGPYNMLNCHSIGILPKPGVTFEFVYAELVPGSVANEGHEKVTCVYPESSVQPNTAAIQTTIPVKGYTVGGVRPTLPAKGDCWFPVQENRIQACYIYTGSMWQEVGCRWYTGSRWIPIYAFDLTTLEDLFDIADAADAIVPIISESGFWRWWQLQWLDFRNYLDGKFDELIAAITGNPVGSDTDITIPDGEGNSKFSFSDLAGVVLSSLLEIATTVLTEFIGLIADLIKMFIQAVMDFIGGLAGVLSDAVGHITTLGDSVAPIGDFVSGIYDAIPDDIEAVLTGSFVVIVAVSVISFLL